VEKGFKMRRRMRRRRKRGREGETRGRAIVREERRGMVRKRHGNNEGKR
jgi:hypothetical protein